MTNANVPPQSSQANQNDRAFLGHPKGLGVLSFTEGCERFSYYSMQTLLVLYMTSYLLLPGRIEQVAGLDWLRSWHYEGLQGQPLSSAIFGDYTSLVYLTPILGGIIADKLTGRRAAMIAGAIAMAVGHFLMAFEGALLFALLLLIIGVGLFKGNIATQVGELYSGNDLRRAMAFQIFYIFINVSVIASPLIAGTLGQKVGWHYGFGCAGVVMVLGLIIYLSGRQWLPHDRIPGRRQSGGFQRFSRDDWSRLIYLLVLIPIIAVAMLTNQQIFNVYLVWGDQQFNLEFLNVTLPSSWLITLDATLSFAMLVAVAAFWKWWGLKRREPDEITKMIIGCLFTMAGGFCLFTAALTQPHGSKIGLLLPFMFHLLNSIGYAHIVPVSLALFTKIAPKQLTGTIVGLYYLAFFGTNQMVGHIGRLYSSLPISTFWLIHVASATFGLVAFLGFKVMTSRRLN